MVDLTEEIWNSSKKTLSGTSIIVAEDPYEICVVVPKNHEKWQAKSAEVITNGDITDIKTSFSQSGRYIEVTVDCQENCVINWDIAFK